MDSDAQSLTPSGESSWSSDRRIVHARLLRALERMRSIDDQRSYEALEALVDTLVMERFTPEATVIAIKEAIGQSTCLSRFELSMRERVRSSLVAACIERYYETCATVDARAPAPRAGRMLRLDSRDDANASG